VAITYTVLTGSKTTEGSIKNWVNRSDIPGDNILLEAEAWIYERLRVREMQARAEFQVDSGSNSEALPADFIDPISWVPYGYTDPLPFYHEDQLQEQRDSDGTLVSGTPSRWVIIGTTVYVDVSASANFTGQLHYFSRPDALSASNETNFLTTRYPSLLRHACMMKAYEHMKDDQRARAYLQTAMQSLSEAMMTNEMFRRGQHIPA
jgi:hypothetical protein